MAKTLQQPVAETAAGSVSLHRVPHPVRDFIIEWSINILILLFGTTTLVQAFIVPTPSMDPTVRVGDHLLVDKLSYAPPGVISQYLLPYTPVRRGDVIVFRYPVNIDENYVKRVMGVPGDHIHLVNDEVYLNGTKLNEPYVQYMPEKRITYATEFPSIPPGPYIESKQRDRAQEMFDHHVVNGELIVPEGYYFAMGDNRDDSADSRYWGLVPRENIIGKPLFIFWSYEASTEDLVGFTANHFIDLATHFFTRTRWDRTFKLVRGYPVQ